MSDGPPRSDRRTRERRIFVGRTGGGQAADAVDERLQFASDGRIGEVGDLFRGDASLANVELLLEFPDHVPRRRNAGGSRGTGSKQPHEISAALGEAACEIVRSHGGIDRIDYHASILVSRSRECDWA